MPAAVAVTRADASSVRLLAAAFALLALAPHAARCDPAPLSSTVAQARPGCRSAVVDWVPIPGAVSYLVRRTGAPDTVVAEASFEDPLPDGVCRSYGVAGRDELEQVGPFSTDTPEACAVLGPPSGLSLGPARALLASSRLDLVLSGEHLATATSFRWLQQGTLRAVTTVPMFSISSAQPGDTGPYRCVAINACGSDSCVVDVAVVPPLPLPTGVTAAAACSSIVVSWHPVDGVHQYMVERYPPWRRITQPDWVIVSDTTYTDTEFFAPTYPDDESYFYMVHSVAYDSLLGSNTPTEGLLRPGTRVQVLTTPQGGRFEAGQMVALQCLASPPEAIRTWRRDGVPLIPQPQDPSNLVLLNAQPAHSGAYDVVVASPCGAETTAVTLVQVCRTPTVTADVRIYPAELGAPSLMLDADAQNADSLRWLHDGLLVPDDARHSGATTNHLEILGVSDADAGIYELQAYGTCEVVGGPRIQVRVGACLGRPLITSQTTGPMLVSLHSAPVLEVVASSCGPMKYHWARRAARGTQTSGFGPDSPTFQIPNFLQEDEGEYWCWVEGVSSWTRTESIWLTLGARPYFTQMASPYSCTSQRIDWATNVPANVRMSSGFWSRCPDPAGTQFYSSPLAASGSATVPTERSLYITATSATGLTYTVPMCPIVSKPSVQAVPFAFVSSLGYYVPQSGEWALPIRVELWNRGCTAMPAPVRLVGLTLQGLGPVVTLDGASALPLALASGAGEPLVRAGSSTVYLHFASRPTSPYWVTFVATFAAGTSPGTTFQAAGQLYVPEVTP